jgi:hypothetical protein
MVNEINWKGCGRKWPWPNASYCPAIFGGTEENHVKNRSLNSQCPGQDSDWAPSKYKSEALLLE